MQPRLVIPSAVIGFALAYSALASSSTVETVPSASMRYSTGGTEVDAGINGGSWASTGVQRTYVDGGATSAGSMLLDLIRYSDAGTRTEVAVLTSFPKGTFEISLASPGMATNPSPWDYYTLVMNGQSGMFTSQVSLDGIGVISN